MGAAKHIKIAMTDKEIKPRQLADRLGMIPQTLYNKLSRDSMTYTDAEAIADMLDCDIVLIDRKTGKRY